MKVPRLEKFHSDFEGTFTTCYLFNTGTSELGGQGGAIAHPFLLPALYSKGALAHPLFNTSRNVFQSCPPT